LILRDSAKTLDIGTIKLYDLELNLTVWDVDAVAGTIYVGHDLIITTVDDIKCDIEVEGNVSSADSDVTGAGSIKLVGTGAQTIDSGGVGLFGSGNFIIDKPSGVATLLEALVLNVTGQDLNILAGTLNLDGYDLTVDDILLVSAGATLKWKGIETITAGTCTFNATSNLLFFDDAEIADMSNIGATTFGHMTFGQAKTHKFTFGVGNEITVNGELRSDGDEVYPALLRSSSDGNQWYIDLQGTSVLADKVDVKDSNADSGNLIRAINAVDSGNNDNWLFASIAGENKFRPRSLTGRGIAPQKLG